MKDLRDLTDLTIHTGTNTRVEVCAQDHRQWVVHSREAPRVPVLVRL